MGRLLSAVDVVCKVRAAPCLGLPDADGPPKVAAWCGGLGGGKQPGGPKRRPAGPRIGKWADAADSDSSAGTDAGGKTCSHASLMGEGPDPEHNLSTQVGVQAELAGATSPLGGARPAVIAVAPPSGNGPGAAGVVSSAWDVRLMASTWDAVFRAAVPSEPGDGQDEGGDVPDDQAVLFPLDEVSQDLPNKAVEGVLSVQRARLDASACRASRLLKLRDGGADISDAAPAGPGLDSGTAISEAAAVEGVVGRLSSFGDIVHRFVDRAGDPLRGDGHEEGRILKSLSTAVPAALVSVDALGGVSDERVGAGYSRNLEAGSDGSRLGGS